MCVVELKVLSKDKASNSPLQAFLEALSYCAMIEANGADIASEVEARFGRRIESTRPVLIVMAPEDYWAWCLSSNKAGNWLRALVNLAEGLKSALGLQSHFLVLCDVLFAMGEVEQVAHLTRPCSLLTVQELHSRMNYVA
jgi:hypothetical protein